MNRGDEIHTGFYSNKAYDFFKCTKMLMQNYWGSRQMGRNWSYIEVLRNPDNEVVLRIKNERYSYDYGYTTLYHLGGVADFNNWLAGLLKNFCLRNRDRKNYWKRDNTLDSQIAGKIDQVGWNDPGRTVKFTVQEVYFVYETLLNRKRRDNHFSDEFSKAFFGEQNDPVATELETARREEVKRLKEEHEAKVNALHVQERQELENTREEICKKFKDLENEEAKRFEDALKELESMLQMATGEVA